MKTNLIKLLEFINDYTNEKGICPSMYEIGVATNSNRTQVQRHIRACEVLKLLLPIQVRNRKKKERNHKLSDLGLKVLKLPIET